MLSADPARLLFHKAILESGASTARSVLAPTHERQESQFRDFLSSCSISLQLTPEETVEQLQAMPLKSILDAAAAVWVPNQNSLRWPFQPVIDGQGGIIPDIPVHRTTSSPPSGALIPVITGFNSHEGAIFLAETKASTPEDFNAFFKTLIPGLSAADLERLAALYPDPADAPSDAYLPRPPGTSPQFCRLGAAYADQAYVAPVLLTAHRNAQAGTPVYVYEFAARGEPFAAANHGSEGDVVARDVKSLGAHDGLVDVSEMMHGLFSRFVASPVGEDSLVFSSHEATGTHWPRFISPFAEGALPEAGEVLVFGQGNDERAGGRSRGTPTSVRRLSSLEIERCRFWWEKMPLSQGMGTDGK
jgi:carboxylesterase type B